MFPTLATVITGASSGIGEALAKQLAASEKQALVLDAEGRKEAAFRDAEARETLGALPNAAPDQRQELARLVGELKAALRQQ